MNAKEFVVRIIKPSPEPPLPRIEVSLAPRPAQKTDPLFSKTLNILIGSAIGILAGMAIYLMLRMVGINYGGLESFLIIGLPSALGILTSLAVF